MAWFLLVLTITLIVLVPVNIYIARKVRKFKCIEKRFQIIYLESFYLLIMILS